MPKASSSFTGVSGKFAVNLDGKGEKDAPLNDIPLVEHEDKFWLPAFYNLGYSADGTWNGDAHAARNATASLKPGIDAGLLHGAYEAAQKASSADLASAKDNPLDCARRAVGIDPSYKTLLGALSNPGSTDDDLVDFADMPEFRAIIK